MCYIGALNPKNGAQRADVTKNVVDMKNLAILATVLFLIGWSTQVKANHYGSQVVIQSESRTPILVEIDRHVTGPAKPVQFVDGLRPGRHYIRIYKMERPRWGWGQPIKRMVYQGRITARQGLVIHFEMGHRGLIELGSHPIHHGYGQPPICNWGGCGGGTHGGTHGGPHGHGYGSGYPGYGHGNPGHGYGYGGYGNGQYGSGYGQGSCGSAYDPYGPGSYGNGYGWYQGYRSPMSDNEFRQLKGRLDDQITDYQKVDYLKQLSSDDYLSTEQVRAILRSMSFDGQKYDAAKLLLPKTVDPDQFDSLAREFTFEHYKKDLERLAESAEQYKTKK